MCLRVLFDEKNLLYCELCNLETCFESSKKKIIEVKNLLTDSMDGRVRNSREFFMLMTKVLALNCFLVNRNTFEISGNFQLYSEVIF